MGEREGGDWVTERGGVVVWVDWVVKRRGGGNLGNGEGRGRCWVDWVVKRREREGGG